MISWLFFLSIIQANIDLQDCGLDVDSQQLAQAIINHPDQKRQQLNCSPVLTQIAQKRAKMQAMGEDKTTPNEYLIKQGYRFPNFYPIHGNQVEAVAKGQNPLEYLTQSDKHKNHVLGIGEFFSLQREIGVGIHRNPDPAIPDQWVVLIAQPWQAPKIKYKEAPLKPAKVKDICPGNWKKSADHSLKRKCKKLAEAAKQ